MLFEDALQATMCLYIGPGIVSSGQPVNESIVRAVSRLGMLYGHIYSAFRLTSSPYSLALMPWKGDLSDNALSKLADWAQSRPAKEVSPITSNLLADVLAGLGLRQELVAQIAPKDLSSVPVTHTENREAVLHRLLRLVTLFSR